MSEAKTMTEGANAQAAAARKAAKAKAKAVAEKAAKDANATIKKLEDRVAVLEARLEKAEDQQSAAGRVLDKVKGKVNGMRDNWKRFCAGYVDEASDGKIGRITPVLMWVAAGLFVAFTAGVLATEVIRWQGDEGKDVLVVLECDEGDDDADYWGIISRASDNMLVFTNADGGAVATLSSAGAWTVVTTTAGSTNYGGDLTLESGEILRNDTDGIVEFVAENDLTGLMLELYSSAQAATGVALLKMTADNDDDAGDLFGIENDGTGNLNIQSDASAKGTLANKVVITKAGKITLADDLVVSGGDIDGAATTLKIGPAIADRVEIADTTIITDIEGPVVLSEEVNLVGTALSVTNAQPVTIEQGCYILSGTGQANNYTNTITLVAPNAAGDIVYLLVATASSNLVAIANGTTVNAPAALELDGDDTAVLMAVDTSTWCLISTSDN